MVADNRESNGSRVPVLDWSKAKFVFEQDEVLNHRYDEAKALAVKIADDEGLSLREIAVRLSQAGYNGVSGKPYGAQSIKVMLQNGAPPPPEVRWYIINGYLKVGPFATGKQAMQAVPLLRDAALLSARNPDDHLELAKMIDALIKAGVKQTDIATVMDRKTSWVCFINNLNVLPRRLITHVQEGKITTSTLIKAVKKYGAPRVAESLPELMKRYPDGVRLTHVSDYLGGSL